MIGCVVSLFQVHLSASDAEEIKPCPRCGAYIMKTNDGSCNRMNCTVCACQFCWLCMQEITDVHYLRCLFTLIYSSFVPLERKKESNLFLHLFISKHAKGNQHFLTL